MEVIKEQMDYDEKQVTSSKELYGLLTLFSPGSEN